MATYTPMQQRRDQPQAKPREEAREQPITRMKAVVRGTPPVDIYENRDEIMLVADMPGTRREELDVRFANDTLTVTATRQIAPQGTPLVQEMAATELTRSFLVPKGIDTANINAELKNGVMRVHLPKSEALKPRQITVNAG